jgi:hypothetical protein
MTLNIKPLTIDTDDAVLLVSNTNPIVSSINFVRGNTYVLQANCFANAAGTVISSFDPSDVWGLYIGRQYESNVNPVVVITDPTKWNNTADWSMSNVFSGNISCRVNVNGSVLDADIANADSQSYTMQIVLTNNAAGKVVVCDSTAYISNAVPF